MSDVVTHDAPKLESPKPVGDKWEFERRAFYRLLPDLLQTHRDQYVAIHDERVVGSGPDDIELAMQAYKQFGYVPIYVGRVSVQPLPVARLPSPRLFQNPEKA
jgi:hypothetical protein